MKNRIRDIRKDRGLTQEELAAKVGISYTHLGRMEVGKRRVSLEMIEQLARALGCRVQDLLPDVAEIAPPQLAEPDAVRYQAGEDTGFEQRVLATLYPGHPNAMLYQVRSPALDQIGYRPGDLVVVDFSQGAVDAVAVRDVVLVRGPENEYGDRESALRLYWPPVLLTRCSLINDDYVDDLQSFAIVGVVKFLLRSMAGGVK